MSFLSTITKSWRRWLRIHPLADLPSGNRDRAARVTTALRQIISSSSPRSGLWQHVEELLRDEFADIKRKAAADRADVNA